MKTLVAIILALGVGFAAAYIIVSKQKAAQPEQLQTQSPVAAAPAPAPVEKVIMAAAPAEESAQDILDDLLNIKLGTGSARNSGLRMVVFKLETLTQRGTAAVPAIRSFLGRNVDVDYNQQADSNNNTNQADASVAANDQNNTNADNGNGGGNNRRNRNRNNGGGFGGFGGGGFAGGFGGGRGGARRARNLQTLQADWVVPPSLRLGLVGTLKEIGGAESEQALAEMLSSTGRGVEVAYLAVMLEEIAPGKYRDAAIAAAKELLMNPPSVDSPDSLDQLSRSYLYGVLEFYKDTSFAVNAQQMLVGADGRLDQDALDYLSTVLKDQSVSALYSAYENQNLTNQFDKMALGREILNYVGQNPQANQMFTETLNNPDLDPRMKLFSIVQVAGGGPFGANASSDPQVVSQKISFLQSLSSQYAGDTDIGAALNATINALQTGDPVNMRDIFNPGGQGGGGGGRRNGGGGFGGGNNGGGANNNNGNGNGQ